MLWWVFRWNPPLSMYHYHLLQCDWFCWAIIIYHDEGYCRHNSSLDNNLHTIAICPDVVRTSGALLRRIVCHASCHPLGFFICKGRAAAARTMFPEHGTLFTAPSWRSIRPGKNDPSLPPLVSYLSVESDTATVSHSPGRLLDTLLEGYDGTLGDEMSQTPLVGGERLPPMRSLAVPLNTGISSGSFHNQTDKEITYHINRICWAYLISVLITRGGF